ncbi:restriction endonuclease subunit S [Enterococcus sp. HY326]|uniref:restriction endonuclease subunit S n=1 Tax=Enterococcus sp. HY326 TaxID=2971265 RepID=UPI00224026BB|nr:restriction endonuclease subunit S [Enterococcus sp. HY326]
MTRGMKKTGIDWVPFAPKGWKILRGKFLYKKMERKIDTDEVVTVFRDGQVVQRKRRRNSGFTNAIKEIGYQGVCKGDLVIHSMDAFAGAIGVSEDNGKCSPVCIVLEGENKVVDNYYFAFLLRVYSNLGYIESMSKGIRVRSTDYRYATFANTLLLVPSLNEQRRIVEIIQSQSTLIDSLISKTQQSIEELKKYKQALITETVTKGLDKNAEMKDSGIEWIGQVPKEWEIKKVRFFLQEVSEKNFPNEKVLSLYRDYGVILKESRDDNHNVTSLDTSSYKLVQPNQLVINKMKAWQGSMAISKLRGIISPAYYIFEIKDNNIDFDFLNYVLKNRSYLDEYRRISAGLRTGQWDLDKNQFKNILFAFPFNIDEQKEIARYINKKELLINNLIEKKLDFIMELHKYKQALIYEYVTGKKEV